MLLDLFSAFRQGDAETIKWAVASVLLALPIILLALCVHETAHGYAANKLGDSTAQSLGRLTLNPIRHLDPIGFLCMLCFGFGWAKPVPINSRYFKKPRRDMAITAVAGPAANLLLALLFTALLKLFCIILGANTALLSNTFAKNIFSFVYLLLSAGIQLNVGLAIFNLLPIPPLDGSKVLYMFLPPNLYFKIVQYERYIYLALLALLALGVITPILSFVSGYILDLFYFIFGISQKDWMNIFFLLYY